MTPVEVFEYKQRWKPGYSVAVHSDKEKACVSWCKQLGKHEWDVSKWTDVYEHTFHFENTIAGQNFEMEFSA